VSEELVKTNPINSMEAIEKMGTFIAKSAMCGASTPAQGMIIATTCAMEAITPMEFARTYHIINNKLSMRADAMAAKFRQLGGKYKILKRDALEARAEFNFEDQTVEFVFTMAEARETGLCIAKGGNIKDIWKKFPANMLWARMISNAIRVICPEVNSGTYTPEEVWDFDDEPQNVIPQEPPKKASKKEVEKLEKDLKKDVKEEPKEMPKAEEAKVVDAEVLSDDPKVCPISGKALGKAWTEFPIEQLTKLSVIKGKGMTDAHRKAVKAEIEKRKDSA